NTDRARTHTLYINDAAYDRLAAAVGDTDGASTPPSGVAQGVKDQVKLTWLTHDVTVWRRDGVVLTRNDGIWDRDRAQAARGRRHRPLAPRQRRPGPDRTAVRVRSPRETGPAAR
ncbi:MAG TPA: hypothetical protein VHJ79_14010, partial [Mycobacterium sp.]|nr:hypothetical protein [Mycobacterium sp.]